MLYSDIVQEWLNFILFGRYWFAGRDAIVFSETNIGNILPVAEPLGYEF